MSPVDPTLVVERMARRLRAQGVDHPVAGAVALAARGHLRLDAAAFAARWALPVETVASAESGRVPFGRLPDEMGRAAADSGADLLVLADLAASWDRRDDRDIDDLEH